MAELDLPRLKALVENAADLTAEARSLSERDRDYYDHVQWTAEEIRVLSARRQPVIVTNRIQRKVDAMVGIEHRGRVDPKAYGRNPQDEDAALAATKALVFVDDQTRFDAKRSLAFENLLIEGIGGVEVGVEKRRDQFEVTVTRLRWEEIFYDPHSREKDFSDASYMGVMKWMTLDAAIEMYGGEEAREMLEASIVSAQDGETYEDRPLGHRSFAWADTRLKRVRVSQMYYRREGVWYLAIFTGGGVISNAPSPYLDEDGQPTNPMILMSAYVNRENQRYGIVRGMISAQDEINKRRSKLLHQLNSRQTMGAAGAVKSIADMKRELASPDGHVEIEPDADGRIDTAFRILDQNDQIAGQASLLQEAKAEIDLIGPDASLMGSQPREQSGRAIMAQQQAGMAALSPVYDALRDWTIRVYRAMWERMRQFWTEPRWIRVTDDARGSEYLAVNAPTGAIDMRTGQMAVQNELARMDMDILMSDVPDYATLRQEQFDRLTRMAEAGFPIPPDVVIEASDLTNKQELLERMRGGGGDPAQQAAAQQQAAQQAAMQQQAIELQMREMMAKVARLEAQAQRDQAAAQRELATIEREDARAGAEIAENEADALAVRAKADLTAAQTAKTFWEMRQPRFVAR